MDDRIHYEISGGGYLLAAFGNAQRTDRLVSLLIKVALLLNIAASAFAGDSVRSVQSLEAFTEPYRSIVVASPEPGRIAKLHVHRGSIVKAGDLLVELDTTVLAASRRIAEQRATTRAKVEAARVESEKKKRRYETLAALSNDGVGTPEELAEAEANARIAELGVTSAEEELQQYALELEEIITRIEQRRIRAEFDGIVTEIYRETSEFVSSVEPELVTLVDLSQLRAAFYLPTEDALKLSHGTTVGVKLIPADTTMRGTIEYIAPTTQAESGRVRVDVLIDNSSGAYRSGLRCTLTKQSALQPRFIEAK